MISRSTYLHAIVSVLIVAASIFYSIPNLYPNQPVIAIDADKVNQTAIDHVLQTHEIKPHWQDQQTLVFEGVESQMRAHTQLSSASIPGHQFSINLRSSAPQWLTAFGAYPMKKGLDLQGGVHFLLRIDPTYTQQLKSDAKLIALENKLMDHSIRFQALEVDNTQYHLRLFSALDAENVKSILSDDPIKDFRIEGEEVYWLEDQSHEGDFISYAIEQTIDSLERRVNELGISEVQIARQGQNHISIDMPGVQDISYAKKIIGKTATLSFHLIADESHAQKKHISDKDGNSYPLQSKPILTGNSIIYANAQMDHMSPVVSIKLDGKAHEFYQATAQSVGRPLAVVYSETKKVNEITSIDEHIISAPIIRQPLLDQFVIQGLESLEHAQELALLLRSGALAAPVEFVEEITIGPSMGEENITNGLLALIAGTAAVSAFMLYYYGVLGLIANIALCLNITMTVAGLSILGATLTLPGIAGLVLSVGMAVDANVLINERIREEINDAQPLKLALNRGYEKALTAIIDANITTILVTFVLFYMGSGAIKGFAVTTCVGIIASMFTAVYFTKNLSLILIDLKFIKGFSFSRQWFSRRSDYNFMGKKHLAFIFSTLIFAFSLITIGVNGINLGLDFTGGSQLIIESHAEASSEDIRSALRDLSIAGAQVQTYGSDHMYMVKIPRHAEISTELIQSIEASIPQSSVIQSSFIGPQIGAEMLTNGIIALCTALFISLIYVALRFEYRFAVSAIISLIHDPVLILGIFALLQTEFDLITLAAMLTIIGYSINDTIVVYDRVRETLQASNETDSSACVNKAINHTLSRTILTSCLTLTAVIAIYIFGGDYLRSFSLALCIGIIIGTYSSIYIAGSLAVTMGLKREDLLPSPSGAI